MKPPFRLVQDTISHETVEALEQLLAMAREGRILGFAIVAMCRRREFFAEAAGEAYRNPVFARGMVASLDDHLSDMIDGK